MLAEPPVRLLPCTLTACLVLALPMLAKAVLKSFSNSRSGSDTLSSVVWATAAPMPKANVRPKGKQGDSGEGAPVER